MTRSSAGGGSGAMVEIGGGSDDMIDEIKLARLLPWNAGRPAHIS